jgi:hypothetical protein
MENNTEQLVPSAGFLHCCSLLTEEGGNSRKEIDLIFVRKKKPEEGMIMFSVLTSDIIWNVGLGVGYLVILRCRISC